jgi:putative PIN family toxin of toxin-antitoxin system
MTRAVIDTNVLLASQFSTNPRSPNVEILDRWNASEFRWLLTQDILEEYAEKLAELGVSPARIMRLLARLDLGGERVNIHFYHLHHYPADADDTAFLLAALNGEASYLVTYDAHLQDVAVFYPEFITCEPLAFLADLRT